MSYIINYVIVRARIRVVGRDIITWELQHKNIKGIIHIVHSRRAFYTIDLSQLEVWRNVNEFMRLKWDSWEIKPCLLVGKKCMLIWKMLMMIDENAEMQTCGKLNDKWFEPYSYALIVCSQLELHAAIQVKLIIACKVAGVNWCTLCILWCRKSFLNFYEKYFNQGCKHTQMINTRTENYNYYYYENYIWL